MKMIKETVEALEPGQKIKIGTKDGTNFFFCGTAETFLENIEEYNAQLSRRAYWRELSTGRALDKMINGKPTMKGYLRAELEKEYPHPSLEGFNSMIKGWMRQCMEQEMRLRAAADYRKNYVSLDKRKVEDERDADQSVEEDVKIIIIAGNETGVYWTMDEARVEPFGIMLAKEGEEIDAV